MVLAIPWTLTLARASRLRPARRRALTFATLFVAAPLFWTFQVFIQVVRVDESLSALTPMLTTLLLALASAGRQGRLPLEKPRRSLEGAEVRVRDGRGHLFSR
jgi:hypothetical protein